MAVVVKYMSFKLINHREEFFFSFDVFYRRVYFFVFFGELLGSFDFGRVGGFFCLYTLCYLIDLF